jgi:dihydrofolate synthase / folylpolyglutamate synthase
VGERLASRVRSLDQWLDYQTQLHPRSIDMGLERLRIVLDRLNWQQPDTPVIIVGGTNGKGSVSTFCEAILSAAGLRVGTFTSPHLRDYRERIRIGGRLVTADELVAAFERIETARGEVGLTFFEFNTLAALLVFEAARLDAWVLEIGLGGRLDAVNVVEPSVAVVVSVGLDHQEYLGDSIEAIAREKAGIFRKDRTAVLGGPCWPATLESIAREVGAPLKRFGIEYSGLPGESGSWRYRGNRWSLAHLPAPALKGDIQMANAATAIAAIEELQLPMTVDEAAVSRGVRSANLAARFQVIEPAQAGAVTWILDVAHNPDAARVLAANLRAPEFAGETLAVCGILADKDAAAIVLELRDCFGAWWCASLDGARGRSGVALAQEVRAHGGVRVAAADTIAAACAAALAAARSGDRIVVFGSFHTVGPAIDWLEAQGLYTAAPRAN